MAWTPSPIRSTRAGGGWRVGPGAVAPLAVTLDIWDAEAPSHLTSYFDSERDSVGQVSFAIGEPLPHTSGGSISDSLLEADFELAIESLGDFTRNNFTMDQIFTAASQS